MDLLTLDFPPEVDFRENTTPAILREADIANMRARVAAIFGQHEIDQLNCAAVPSGLLENELFGHENAAFTGALAQERDRIELAHQGSLFLDEIGDIGHYFVSTLSRKMRKSIRIIPVKVMNAITSFSWPGNIRELRTFVERSVILSRGETLAAPISELDAALVPPEETANTLHGMEREMILNVLRAAGGKLSGSGGAAERLGLKRTTLQRKMERLGILKSDYA